MLVTYVFECETRQKPAIDINFPQCLTSTAARSF